MSAPHVAVEGSTTERVAELVAAAEADGVTLRPSHTPGRFHAAWPSGEVADRYRPLLLRNRPRVLEVLVWPVCNRCRCRARRVVPAYWGEDLCPSCCAVIVAEYDELDRWPPEPWPATPRPAWPGLPRSRLPSTLSADPVLAAARDLMVKRGGSTITRADVHRAELLTGQYLEVG